MEHENLGPIGICNKWDLLGHSGVLEQFSMTKWQKMAASCEAQYRELPKARLGSVMLDLHYSNDLLEAKQSLSSLAAYTVLFDTVWLPDPLYTFLVKDAGSAWRRLPESGSSFMGPAGVSLPWKQLWDYAPSERRLAATSLAKTIGVLELLRPLVQLGAIKFFPWEKLIENDPSGFKEAVLGLANAQEVQKVTTAFDQDQYSMGVRCGPMGIVMKEGNPEMGIAPGTKLHFVDKRHIIATGLLHGMVAAHTAANFIPRLPGDRNVYDFLMSQGNLDPKTTPIGNAIRLPKLSAAMWPDIEAIRRNSDTVRVFRSLIQEASGVPEDRILPDMKDRLAEAAAKMGEDVSLMRAVKGETMGFAVGVLGGATSVLATGGTHKQAVFGGITGAVAPFLWSIYRTAFGADSTEARRRSELICRVSDRLL